MKKRKYKFQKKKRIRHETKIIGLVISIVLLLLVIRIIDLKFTGYAIWTTSNATDFSRGGWNNTILNQTTGAVSLIHGNASEINYTIPPFDADNGLILYMKFNNNSAVGDNATYTIDYSGNGNHGRFGNSSENTYPNWTKDGKINSGLAFDGKDDWINVSYKIDNNITLNMTLSAWIYAYPTSLSGFSTIISKGYTLSLDYSLELEHGNGGNLYFNTYNYTNVNSALSTNYNANKSNSSHHILATFSYAFGCNGVMRIYIDGVNVATKTGICGAMRGSTEDISIGKLVWGGSATRKVFNGTIDEVMIFNRTLNASEISTIYELQKEKYPETGTYESEVLSNDNSSVWKNITFGGQYDYSTQKLMQDNSNYGKDGGLVAYFKFDNKSTDTYTLARDEYLTTNATFYSGGIPNWNNSGKQDFGINFAGSNNDILTFAPSSQFNSSNFSICTWLKPLTTSFTGNIFANGYTKCDDSALYGGYQLEVSTFSDFIALYTASDNNCNTKDTAIAAVKLSFPGWNYICVTRNTTHVGIYLNGKLINNTANVNTGKDICYYSTDPFMGSYSYTSTYDPEVGCDDISYAGQIRGMIDEFTFWNRTLNKNEVNELYYMTAYKLKAQVRSCSEATCSNGNVPYIGPDNTTNTYYTNTSNLSTGLPNTTFFQYKLLLETDDSLRNESPLVYNMTIGYISSIISAAPDTTPPTLDFVSPTPANNTATTNPSQEINISITEVNLTDLTWNWNGTNYTIYNDSLVLMLNFDNNTEIGDNSSLAVDSSKYSNNATFGNVTANNKARPNWTTGKFGSALQFDGNDDYISVPDSNILDLTNTFTVAFWINPTTASQSSSNDLFRKDGNDNTGFGIEQDGSGNGLSYNFFWYSGGSAICWSNPFVLSANEWQQVVIVKNASTRNVFINGTRITSALCDGTAIITANTAPLDIGTFTAYANRNFNGMMDEFMIFNRSLTAGEVQQLYKSNLRKYDPANWAFYTNQSINATTSGSYYTYFASAQDSIGNANRTDVRYTTYDATPPLIQIISPINASYTQNSTMINITNNSDAIAVWWTNNSGVNNYTYNDAMLNYTYPNGAYELRAYANDSANNQNMTRISFTINYISNNAPSISDIQYYNSSYADKLNTNITKVYRGQNLTIRIIANDNDGNSTITDVESWYQMPNNTWNNYTQAFDNVANAWFAYNITIPNNDSWLGYINITANVTDGAAFARREEYSTVEILNNQPALTSISNQNINEDNDLYLDLSTYASDVEDTQFTYQYTNNNTGLISIAIANSTGNLSANPALNQFGAASITVTAVDTDSGLSAARSFEVIIASVNDAPTLNAMPNQNMNEDTNLYLNVSAYANDTEDALAQIKYQYTNNNTNLLNITIGNSTGNLTAYPAANQFGAAAIIITAFDAQSASSAARSFEIIIANVNDAPNITLISPSNGTYEKSSSIFMNITVDDIDRDSLTVDFIVNTSAVNETFSNITGFNKLNYTAALNDGFHNWTANVTDGSLTNQSEIRFFTIDTIIPVITYNTSTFANNTYTNASSIIVNASIAEQYMDNLTFELFTSSAVANKTVMANDNNNNYTITFSIAADGLYFYNASMYDRADNYNATDARAITIDRIIPVAVYNTSTQANNSFLEQNYIFVNISLVESNLGNMTFRLYNQTALINATVYTGNNRSINWSIENQNAVYKYNITIYDLAGNINQTDTRTITLDNTMPAISITAPANGTSYATGSTVTINYAITEANFDKCWYQLGNLTNVTLDCDGVGINNQTAIKGWNNITMFANDSAGHENKSAVISFLIDSVPDIPTLIMPENNTQKLFSNITFLFNSNDSDGDAFTYNIVIANDSAFSSILDDKYASSNTSYNNFSFPQGTLYYRIRANDSVAYSNYSEVNSFEFVNATLNIYSPSNNTVIYPAQTIAIYVNETARYDWTTNVTLTITGDGVNEDYKPVNLSSGQNMSWNYNYTVPSSLGPSIITITARAYNGTAENINSSLDLIVTRSVGSAVGSPSITSFTTDPTYALQSSSVNISLYISTDTVLSAINTSIELPNNTNLDISHMGYSKNNLNYSYNYTYNATDIGNYTVTTLVTDANNQQATASRSFYTSSNVTIATSLTGINNAAIKDVSSKKVLLSGASINEGLPRGKYDIEFNVNNKPTITLENASINESFTLSFNYTNLDESTGPSGYRTLDRFQLDNNLEFTRANISYNYSSILSSITTESNLEFHKCSNPDSCTWVQVAAAIDSDNDTITGLFSNFSSFALAERAASTTSTSTVYGSGGGSGGGASNTKFYDLNIIVPSLVSFGLNSKAIVPISIKNNGQIGLSSIKLTIIPNSTDLKAYSNLNNIPYLDVNREITTDITIETANTSGSYSIAVKAESSNPNFVEVSYIYINSGISTISSNKTIIIEKIKFVKDLFKENPECLELNEIVLQAEDAIKENKIEKAVALTETAINACKDLVTSKGKVIRIPGKSPYTMKQLITYVSILAILLITLTSIIWYFYYNNNNKKKKIRKMFNRVKKLH